MAPARTLAAPTFGKTNRGTSLNAVTRPQAQHLPSTSTIPVDPPENQPIPHSVMNTTATGPKRTAGRVVGINCVCPGRGSMKSQPPKRQGDGCAHANPDVTYFAPWFLKRSVALLSSALLSDHPAPHAADARLSQQRSRWDAVVCLKHLLACSISATQSTDERDANCSELVAKCWIPLLAVCVESIFCWLDTIAPLFV